MAKVKEVVRFSRDRNNMAPLTTPSKVYISSADILNAIENNPGLTSKGVAYAISESDIPTKMFQANVAGRLTSMINAVVPKIKRTHLDGMYRYYPITSLMGGPTIQKDNTRTSSTVQRKFRCLECGKDFESKRALGSHQHRMHTEAGREAARKGIEAMQKAKAESQPTAEAQPNKLALYEQTLRAAQEFYWDRSANNLKEFVEWLKTK